MEDQHWRELTTVKSANPQNARMIEVRRLVGAISMVVLAGFVVFVLSRRVAVEPHEEITSGSSEDQPATDSARSLGIATSVPFDSPAAEAQEPPQAQGADAGTASASEPHSAEIPGPVDGDSEIRADGLPSQKDVVAPKEPTPEIIATRRMYMTHAPLRQQAIADPDSVENRRILQTMVEKAIRRRDSTDAKEDNP